MTDPNLATKTGASLNRHRSETTVGTPQAFVDACARRYGSGHPNPPNWAG